MVYISVPGGVPKLYIWNVLIDIMNELLARTLYVILTNKIKIVADGMIQSMIQCNTIFHGMIQYSSKVEHTKNAPPGASSQSSFIVQLTVAIPPQFVDQPTLCFEFYRQRLPSSSHLTTNISAPSI